jgi:hypothetical protein
MGKYDSSRTRVVPVFDELTASATPSSPWLPPLLHLGSRSTQLVGFDPGPLLPNHGKFWGKTEKRLDAPKSLLSWLVQNASRPSSETLWGGPTTREKREKLVDRDPTTIAEALRLLNTRTQPGVWYVLEGRSSPDVFFETEFAIIVIEGKRTEYAATSVTTWMPNRSQMLRHMDAAHEIRGDKRVFGMMIVEGCGGADAVTASDHWVKQARKEILEPTLSDSLPHRSVEERQQIAAGFLGVTTWQRVCAEFSIPWPPYNDLRD